MTEWSVWPAPAKINLFLHVLGRRADGYHELQTAFQLLGYGDRIWLRPRVDGRVERCSHLPGVAAEDDLTVRAARALQAATGSAGGVDIHVDKRLPAGGGVGGGSSDAATVLVALNHLWQTGLDEEALAGIGLALGADVPVFVRGRSAWGEGVGEQLRPMPVDPAGSRWYLVVDPGASISTAEVFGAPELTRDTSPITIPDLRAGAVRNDCEPVVRSRWPAVAEALEWLGRHGQARMSGTGSCCFVGFPGEAEAQAALERLPGAWSGFVAQAVERSPLHLTLAEAARTG
ncbi:4-(cytidine 5'-diphospho)-2-C-methyl-D-erythritol kinase [Halorhodospira halophila]|uniref:4-diphosphocytidyl-2-C-methyl-D-erythritol kinase n=1 Tax=Halorhodospira halophila (strain DSM 244 / SL1) TaxID=349124 RepID=ISPE_HALHL|nr:4-(cytidine 5'-diphospho)-2-C-methyl-D-erythritol kinase [Halorhodospira halophila]A1WVQ4.1 RecName: Full=4-diphosphocytidyl-2-C-methyl-D-erythritol kinase; Short=CMK; AltName: Full=4-(cytidine-5'-diphospho)-2-C-methyl-D-erythritol kinase [Halorhodospira halophila SL1]ABM61766.1 4-diphosphocytidyl-2-C-methyl-D-erythritol kinase [Halorhodospira halophila SL1]MBK1728905.1 4-diphosphocytidyl-2C-methyl-D-erythritol kinase [Halorhodospira halophila]